MYSQPQLPPRLISPSSSLRCNGFSNVRDPSDYCYTQYYVVSINGIKSSRVHRRFTPTNTVDDGNERNWAANLGVQWFNTPTRARINEWDASLYRNAGLGLDPHCVYEENSHRVPQVCLPTPKRNAKCLHYIIGTPARRSTRTSKTSPSYLVRAHTTQRTKTRLTLGCAGYATFGKFSGGPAASADATATAAPETAATTATPTATTDAAAPGKWCIWLLNVHC